MRQPVPTVERHSLINLCGTATGFTINPGWQFAAGIFCISQFGIGLLSLSQITVAYLAIARIGFVIDRGIGQIILRLP